MLCLTAEWYRIWDQYKVAKTLMPGSGQVGFAKRWRAPPRHLRVIGATVVAAADRALEADRRGRPAPLLKLPAPFRPTAARARDGACLLDALEVRTLALRLVGLLSPVRLNTESASLRSTDRAANAGGLERFALRWIGLLRVLVRLARLPARCVLESWHRFALLPG
jgi:hypothetical protein